MSGSSKLFYEPIVELTGGGARTHALIKRAHDRCGFRVESKVSEGIVGRKTPRLPSAGLASLDYKESDAGCVSSAGIEERAEDFFLRRAELDFGDRASQVGGARGERGSRLRCYLCCDATRDLSAQLDGMAAEALLDHPFHDWFDPTSLRTSFRTPFRPMLWTML